MHNLNLLPFFEIETRAISFANYFDRIEAFWIHFKLLCTIFERIYNNVHPMLHPENFLRALQNQ